MRLFAASTTSERASRREETTKTPKRPDEKMSLRFWMNEMPGERAGTYQSCGLREVRPQKFKVQVNNKVLEKEVHGTRILLELLLNRTSNALAIARPTSSD